MTEKLQSDKPSQSEPDDYKQKYLLLSAQHVREVERLESELVEAHKTLDTIYDQEAEVEAFVAERDAAAAVPCVGREGKLALIGKQHPLGGYVHDIGVVHNHECPYWRIGKKHGPCNCGALELETEIANCESERKDKE